MPQKTITPEASSAGVNISTTQRSVLRLSTPKIEILIGGPYTSNGEEHPYGHVALRVISEKSDTTYDFGRYGKTWGIGDSEGDGILNVWNDSSKYISTESSLGRITTGFVFDVTASEAERINAFYEEKTGGNKPIKSTPHMKRYKLKENYHALGMNCTTISMDGAKSALPKIDNGSGSYIEGRGLGFKEKAAARIDGWPKRIFMPADLQEFLKEKSSPQKINQYGQKK